MLKLIEWLWWFVWLLCLVQSAPTKDPDLLYAPRQFSSFKLLKLLHHSVDPGEPVFQELDVTDSLWTFSDLAHFTRGGAVTYDTPLGGSRIPDPRDKITVLALADMSLNSYENRNTTDRWKPVPGYNVTLDFGWEDNGLQGYLFGAEDLSMMIMAIKGTTFKFFGEGGTSENDRLMDNLMFSCCCSFVDSGWVPVCGCYTGGNSCSATCLSQIMNGPEMYVNIAQEIFDRALQLYPSSEFWFTGHSLGGSLASVLAARNSRPAFAYQAPGELLYAERIGLKIDRNQMGKYSIYHFGNDADPIFLGTCQGRFSTCYQFRYAMETKCHIGSTCIYDGGPITNINNHRLSVCINRFYTPDPVPECFPEVGCVDCPNWNFEMK